MNSRYSSDSIGAIRGFRKAVVFCGNCYIPVFADVTCQTGNSIAQLELRVYIQSFYLKQKLYFLGLIFFSMRTLKCPHEIMK